jgi:hypothetical protein
MAGWTGLEPAAFRVTGGRYNQLNYHPMWSVSEPLGIQKGLHAGNKFLKKILENSMTTLPIPLLSAFYRSIIAITNMVLAIKQRILYEL